MWNKIKVCEEIGIKFVLVELFEDCIEGEIIIVLKKFNEDIFIYGVFV